MYTAKQMGMARYPAAVTHVYQGMFTSIEYYMSFAVLVLLHVTIYKNEMNTNVMQR